MFVRTRTRAPMCICVYHTQNNVCKHACARKCLQKPWALEVASSLSFQHPPQEQVRNFCTGALAPLVRPSFTPCFTLEADTEVLCWPSHMATCASSLLRPSQLWLIPRPCCCGCCYCFSCSLACTRTLRMAPGARPHLIHLCTCAMQACSLVAGLRQSLQQASVRGRALTHSAMLDVETAERGLTPGRPAVPPQAVGWQLRASKSHVA